MDASSKVDFIHPKDRYGQPIGNRYTSTRVNAALARYVEATGRARAVTKASLRVVCAALLQESLTIIQASHVALILQTALMHATAAAQQGWVLPEVGTSSTLSVSDLAPYWMDNRSFGAVRNDVSLQGVFLLTAPNMSGG